MRPQGGMLTIVPRADRLALRFPIAYRSGADEEWFQSRVVNISESGVLFGPTALARGASVEVMFAAPRQIGSLPAGTVICVAEIVRTDEAGAAGARFDSHRSLFEP